MRERATEALAAAGIEFDRDSGDVRGPAGAARLAPQPAALLDLLAARAGDVVTREELKAHLWPGGRVEFDQGIAFALREVRKTLEEVGADPAVVETLPRRGLRLGAPEADTPAAEPAAGGGRPRRRTRAVLVGVALVVAIAGGLRWAAGSDGPPVLVVFPYTIADDGTDRGPDAGPSDADVAMLAEAVVASLTSSLQGEAGVVGPAGVAGLGGPDDVEGARRSLGACLVLSGSVRPLAPDTLIVFTQIVRTADRVHVWAERDTLPMASAPGLVADRILDGARDAVARC